MFGWEHSEWDGSEAPFPVPQSANICQSIESRPCSRTDIDSWLCCDCTCNWILEVPLWVWIATWGQVPIQGKPRLVTLVCWGVFGSSQAESGEWNPRGTPEGRSPWVAHPNLFWSARHKRRNDTLGRTWRRLWEHSCSFSILVQDKTFESCSFLDAHLLEKDASWWFGLCVQISDGHDRIRIVDN